jgi:hypothetical protein
MGKPDVTTINNKWWKLQYKICMAMADFSKDIATLCSSWAYLKNPDPNLDGPPEAHAQDYKNALHWIEQWQWWITQAEEVEQKLQPPKG